MAVSVHDLSDADARARYSALWAGAVQRSPFSSLAYADAVQAAFGLRCQLHLADHNAGAILYLKGRGLLKRVTVPPFTQYSAIVLKEPVPHHLVHQRKSPLELLLASIEQHCHKADLLLRTRDPRPAQWRGWHVRPLFTYVLDPAASTGNWSATARRVARTKTDLFELCEDSGFTRRVIDLCLGSYGRHHRNLPAKPRVLEHLVGCLSSQVRTFAALDQGEVAAGIIVLHDKRTAHYWIAGSRPGPAMTVLIGHVLTALQATGIASFDLVGANTPAIAEFKRAFGPSMDLYYHLKRGLFVQS